MKNNRTVLGMNLDELSLRDICEEITDIKKDLRYICEYENGTITYAELVRECMVEPEEKTALVQGLKILQEEKERRNNIPDAPAVRDIDPNDIGWAGASGCQ